MTNKKLNIVSVGSTPMTKKINRLLESLDYVDLTGVVNLNPEKFSYRSNFEVMYDFKMRRPDDILYVEDINDKNTIAWIRHKEPDLIIQSGWSQIWKEEVLSIPKNFCLGVHAAPLPIGKGAAILNWILIEGGGAWGNSLFVMDEKTDVGDVLDFEPFNLETRDDVRTAYLKADRTSLVMLKRTLPKILENNFERKSQSGIKGTRYYKRTPEDGEMSFSWNAEKIHNYVRALTHPYPGSFFNTRFGKIVVWSSGIDDSIYDELPGTLLKIEEGKGILVQAGEKSAAWLYAIEPENDVEVWSDIWAGEFKLTEKQSLV